MKKQKLIFSLILFVACSSFVFAQSQTFETGKIPQTILSDIREDAQCQHTDAGSLVAGAARLAFYNGQYKYIASTLKANDISSVLSIINTTNGQYGGTYPEGAPDSTKVFIYNPYGAFSSTGAALAAANSYVPDIFLKSNVKPAGIDIVYVWYQDYPTYLLWVPGKRNQVLAQVVHNIRRRSPWNINNGSAFTYSYLAYSPSVPGGIPGSVTLHPQFINVPGWDRTDNGEYLCENVYVARCGDAVKDNYLQTWVSASTNGYQGMFVEWGIVPWAKLTGSVLPLEQCDDGANNGTSWSNCNLDCTLKSGWCGDGVVNAWTEECDYGPLNGSDLCTINCSIPPIDAPVDEAVNE